MQNFMSQKHRTNIHDISNPVAFTVSLTDFPCVSGAVFSKKCLMKSMNSFKIKKTNFKRLYDNSLREEIKICQNPFIIVKKSTVYNKILHITHYFK